MTEEIDFPVELPSDFTVEIVNHCDFPVEFSVGLNFRSKKPVDNERDMKLVDYTFNVKPGDIVVVQYAPEWTTTIVVGLNKGEYYFLPSQGYQWAALLSQTPETVLSPIPKGAEAQMSVIRRVGQVDSILLPGYSEQRSRKAHPSAGQLVSDDEIHYTIMN